MQWTTLSRQWVWIAAVFASAMPASLAQARSQGAHQSMPIVCSKICEDKNVDRILASFADIHMFSRLRDACADGTAAGDVKDLASHGVVTTVDKVCRAALEHSAAAELNPATPAKILADEGILAPYINLLWRLSLPIIDDVRALKLIGITNDTITNNLTTKPPEPDPISVKFLSTGKSYEITPGLAADSAFSAVIEGYKKTKKLPPKPARTRAQIESALDSNSCFESLRPGANTSGICAAAGHDLAAIYLYDRAEKK